MKNVLAAVLVVFLGACASPTFNMTPEQVKGLSDDQLCTYANSYRGETKMNEEIARRNLNCNRHYRECLRRGNKPGTQAMAFCEDLVRENERLRYERSYDDFDVFGYGRYGRHHSRTGVGVGFGF